MSQNRDDDDDDEYWLGWKPTSDNNLWVSMLNKVKLIYRGSFCLQAEDKQLCHFHRKHVPKESNSVETRSGRFRITATNNEKKKAFLHWRQTTERMMRKEESRATEDTCTSVGLVQLISASEVKDWFREEHFHRERREKM